MRDMLTEVLCQRKHLGTNEGYSHRSGGVEWKTSGGQMRDTLTEVLCQRKHLGTNEEYAHRSAVSKEKVKVGV